MNIKKEDKKIIERFSKFICGKRRYRIVTKISPKIK